MGVPDTRRHKQTVHTTHCPIFLLENTPTQNPTQLPVRRECIRISCCDYSTEQFCVPWQSQEASHCKWTATESINYLHAIETSGSALAKIKVHSKTYKDNTARSSFLHSGTLLDLKLCHTYKPMQNRNLNTSADCIRHNEHWRTGIKKGRGSGCHMLTLHEAACTVSGIKCCVNVWVIDWSGVSGFVCLLVLQVVHLERNRVTVYWLTWGTVMEGNVLL